MSDSLRAAADSEMVLALAALEQLRTRHPLWVQDIERYVARLTERCDAYREVADAAQAYIRASWNAPADPITQREWGELSRAVAALASPAGEQKDKGETFGEFCERIYQETGGVTPELRRAYEFYRANYRGEAAREQKDKTT